MNVVTKRYVVQNGTLQNGTWYKTVRGTKRYVVQNGTWYKTVRGTKWYVVQNGTLQNRTLQNGMVTKRYGYKMVTVTKW
jgi:hypothetical protein